jgi:hypothetical protein
MSKKQEQPEQPKVRWTTEISVDRIWVEDGYYLTEENVLKAWEEAMKTLFPGAYKSEVVVKLLKGPPPELIKAMQKH